MSRITLYQGRPCARIPSSHVARIRATKPDILCLPEYFWVPATARSHRDASAAEVAARSALVTLSTTVCDLVVGGSMVVARDGRLWNTCAVYERGVRVGEHVKVRPTPGEVAAGVAPGDGFLAIEAGGRRIGILICADVLDPTSFETMRSLCVDLIVAPTLSPYRAIDTLADKARRDRDIFAAGARTARAPVVKVCGVGRIFGSRLQGRSLVADADGVVLARVAPDDEGRVKVLAVELAR